VRVLFGPENDHRHTPDPAPSGAYEWWYFDAISDDQDVVVVVIFFLGSPMSPYYRAVVRGRRPDPMDWCGVFVSVHERTDAARWKEIAYAYNLGHGGDFPTDAWRIRIDDSVVEFDGLRTWRLVVSERGLWGGCTTFDLTFESVFVPQIPESFGVASAADDRHTWVCTAPYCRVHGNITLPGRGARTVAFRGAGYHDHNAGSCPFDALDRWTWARAHVMGSDDVVRTVVVYRWTHAGDESTDLLIFEPDGSALVCMHATADILVVQHGRLVASVLTPRALQLHDAHVCVVARATRAFGNHPGGDLCVRAAPIPRFRSASASILADGPFYRRQLCSIVFGTHPRGSTPGGGSGIGIGETFTAARLGGPITSRAIWTRLRRRRNNGAAS
jgi:hypothetical protein